MTTPDKLVVAIDLGGDTVDAAIAHFNRRGGTISTTIQYFPDYLSDRRAYPIDPGIPLTAGSFSVRGLPGAFSDCAPDRWGKNLVTKRLAAEAREQGRRPATVTDIDLLVGVADATRQGALRFREVEGDAFLHSDASIPPLVDLPRLLRAADRVTFGPQPRSSDLAAIKELLAAGTGTLGGARPKASVRYGNRLLIAKFPHRDDTVDVMAWECTALDLAERAGIEVPRHRIARIDGRTVLLLDRFDRHPSTGQRVGYISAMTLTEHTDGDTADYLDLAAALSVTGQQPKDDLVALWRRMAFSVAIHNTDDHLRNHGFLHFRNGWTLAPLFDVNPDPDPHSQRVTGISGARAADDEIDALMTSAAEFGLAPDQAAAILAEVFTATRDWRSIATANGISGSQIAVFESAFEQLRDEVALAIGKGGPGSPG
ncbi:type II toxin-antitoxin system HipA family toxin [Nocardia mangyaensis]|uniref:type II toxin-antitoxin system HipA family toxin n=1 Tax=Nocardia mangyaensis TaxID=2213200 RepID=UPI002674DDA2|nr:HipA domain-containing protein [Nocardia mangyaensis]MDO3650854.1 HipA domain-containing protein [Nocardia mangyaensis]